MNENLKILDKFDKESNIYELVEERSRRAHDILNGAMSAVMGHDHFMTGVVMDELIRGEEIPAQDEPADENTAISGTVEIPGTPEENA